jgi:O-antigen ligase
MMNERSGISGWMPSSTEWAMLAAVLAVALIGNWLIAAVLTVLLIVQIARPLDFLTAFLLVVGGASFVFYEGGRLTLELSLVSGAVLWMLLCYVLSRRGRVLAVPRTSLTVPLLLYLALALISAARGFLSQYSPRYIGIELLAALALASALLVGCAFDRRRDLKLATFGLILISFADLTTAPLQHMHTQGSYDAPVPGLVGLMLVNLAFRAKSRRIAQGWVILSLPLFLHQFLTFGRGLWLGCIAGLLLSLFTFAGFGRGSRRRWSRAGQVLAVFVLAGALGAIGASVMLGKLNLLSMASNRFESITGTKMTGDSGSNIMRLVEYGIVARDIGRSPWIGHGYGFTFIGKNPLTLQGWEQFWVHQNFLLIWLKQGLVGLLVFLWMLWSAIALGVREARRRADPAEATWFATVSATTLSLSVLAMTNFPFAKVDAVFLLALLWGGAMAMTRTGLLSIQWAPPKPAAARVPRTSDPVGSPAR